MTMIEQEMEMVLVETISQYRIRYIVEVPVGKTDWALDTVTCDMAKEFSQQFVGESLLSSRVIEEEEMLELFVQDNSYAKSWSIETIYENCVTLDKDIHEL